MTSSHLLQTKIKQELLKRDCKGDSET